MERLFPHGIAVVPQETGATPHKLRAIRSVASDLIEAASRHEPFGDFEVVTNPCLTPTGSGSEGYDFRHHIANMASIVHVGRQPAEGVFHLGHMSVRHNDTDETITIQACRIQGDTALSAALEGVYDRHDNASGIVGAFPTNPYDMPIWHQGLLVVSRERGQPLRPAGSYQRLARKIFGLDPE